jgi:branched-chain amino acid transport system permease protein
MTLTLLLEQTFNGLQAGVTLFLVAAGLTLILGIMDFVFLAHGAQVMIGAYAAAAITQATGNFFIGLGLAVPITFASGYLLELLIIRHLYRRDHMEQVLATFGLILFFNEAIRIGFGPAALYSDLSPALSGFAGNALSCLPAWGDCRWSHVRFGGPSIRFQNAHWRNGSCWC